MQGIFPLTLSPRALGLDGFQTDDLGVHKFSALWSGQCAFVASLQGLTCCELHGKHCREYICFGQASG